MRGARVSVSGFDIAANDVGMRVQDDGVVNVTGGTALHSNDAQGVLVVGGRLTMRNAEARENASDGVRMESGTMGELQGNDFNGNQGWGIFCQSEVVLARCSNTYTSNGSGDSNCKICN